MKAIIPLFMFLLVVSIVLGVKPTVQSSRTWDIAYPKIESYRFGENVSLDFHVFNENGKGIILGNASCVFHAYLPNGSHLLQTALVADGIEYEVKLNTSVLNVTGEYPYIVQCSNATNGGFVSNAFYVSNGRVTGYQSDDLTPVAALILVPLLFSFVLLAAAATLNSEEHGVLKIFLFLLSMVPMFLSLWWGGEAVARFYDFAVLNEAIADGTFVFGIVFSVLIMYVMIYGIYRMIQAIAEKKSKELNY